MPQATQHQSKKVTKLLNLGDSGGGKTGALACLAKAGYRLVIVDFDNGLDILINLAKDDKKALENIYYETFTDKMQMTTGLARTKDNATKKVSVITTKGPASAFTDGITALTNWKFPVSPGSTETYNLGSVYDWGPETILVIDSLGFAGAAALRFIRQLNQHQFDAFTSKPDYGQAMNLLEGMLQMLYADNVKCHVIVNTHITYIEDIVTDVLKGMPRALGSKLPPNVGGYFNTMIRTTTEGVGTASKKVIKTVSEASLELKCPVAPGVLPAKLPIESGLLTIFKKLQEADWIEPEPK